MRQCFITANWKMFKTESEAVKTAESIKETLAGVEHRIALAPPFTALSAVSRVLKGSNIELAAQNMGPALEGAFTGEVSVCMLRSLGVGIVILGHSERRQYYNENNDALKQKIHLAVEHGLDVIFCVGENIECRRAKQHTTFVEEQLRTVLYGMEHSIISRITIAYEPIWAIGTGETASPDDANTMHSFIRGKISEWFTPEIAGNIIIQYGGSVKPENIAALMEQANIDGALVGGASLEVESFKKIVCFKG